MPAEGFESYWFNTGGRAQVLLEFLRRRLLKAPLKFGEPILLNTKGLNSLGTEEASPVAVLFQAGYLTIKRRICDNIFELGYPNKEVSLSMGRLYADILFRSCDKKALRMPYLRQTLSAGTLDDAINIFNKAFNALDYCRYSVSDEASCRSFLQMLMIGADLDPLPEKHCAHGRSDLEVTAGDRHWVFELKFLREKDSGASTAPQAWALLEEAAQQIRSRLYGQTTHGKDLKCAALVFSEQKRQFVDWQLVALN